MTCVWLRGLFDAIPSANPGRTCVQRKDCYRRIGGCRPTALDDDEIVDDCRQAVRRESVMASRLALFAQIRTRPDGGTIAHEAFSAAAGDVVCDGGLRRPGGRTRHGPTFRSLCR